MPNKYLTVRLDNTKIDLNTRISLSYDKTNLPKHAFSFKSERPIFWKLLQISYDSASGTLNVAVMDYNASAETIQNEQEAKYPINELNFERLDWIKFEPQIFSYRLGQLKYFIINYRDKLLDLRDEENEDVKQLKRTAPNIFFSNREKLAQELEIDEKIWYEDARFDKSKIVFTVHLKLYGIEKQLEIINPILRPEFEYIKLYFVKRLGKYFVVKLKVKLLDGVLEEVVATSDDINNINENLVNTIRTESVLNLKHFKTERVDKSLYNLKELSSETNNISLLTTSANDILETFIKNGNVKNVKQLEYLSRDKQSLNERLQFTIKPLFGFVFHDSEDKQCFIWELLNSHATYIWKSNYKDNKLDLGLIVEQAITTIKNEGRDAYKRYYKAMNEAPFDFGVIDHHSNNLTDDERFSEWRKKMEIFCLQNEQ
jgi:hypothetical protein